MNTVDINPQLARVIEAANQMTQLSLGQRVNFVPNLSNGEERVLRKILGDAQNRFEFSLIFGQKQWWDNSKGGSYTLGSATRIR